MSVILRLVVICALLLALSAPAPAAEYVRIEQRLSPEQMRQTGLDRLSVEQLELLNQLLQMPATASATTAGDVATASDDGSLAFIGLGQASIHARARGRVEGWEPGSVFELDNGQRWQVLKGKLRLREPVESPEILLVPGIAGRWFLQVDEDLPKARVFRID
ncbi:hypothetical protein CSC70_10410 [Pseudoxanthomonas kalamensis DSM 18571]|uniref:hypothetical protein n=1 Tax=Pseudoxanthomonas kalamensis TaxID=289483 RepID=UPI0013912C2D|nr:hypothetical protein [Pseudoxanthomonas kalamensis]KAF1709232.1 hypothetical protein CSC70_10410 [Pseudoxanthomonas kalamensis DSM 18571]